MMVLPLGNGVDLLVVTIHYARPELVRDSGNYGITLLLLDEFKQTWNMTLNAKQAAELITRKQISKVTDLIGRKCWVRATYGQMSDGRRSPIGPTAYVWEGLVEE